MKPIAFCDRVRDLAAMTILEHEDGRLTARRREPGDSIQPTHQTGRHHDLWVERTTGRRYVRHDEMIDIETGEPSYDFSCFETGRLWMRPIAEWHEIVDGRPRFELFP